MERDKDLDITTISKDILKQALTKGFFTLPNSEEIRELTVNQILSLAKAVVKDGLVIETKEEDNTNLPSDLFIQRELDAKSLDIIEDYSKDKEEKLIFLDLDKA